MLVGKRILQLIFPYSIIENSPTSFACKSVFVGPNGFKFGTKTFFYDLIGHIKIWDKSIMVYIIMFLMTLYANHQYL